MSSFLWSYLFVVFLSIDAVDRNTKRKGTCWYFASPQGCRKGDKCQFIHDTSTVPALKHPSAPLPGMLVYKFAYMLVYMFALM